MNMLDEKILSELRIRLQSRRRELLDFRSGKAASWQELSRPEAELEETAAKENLARGIDQLDSRSRAQIDKIDAALAKIDEGRYGVCEVCDNPIAVKRLQVVPEARQCIRCAQMREHFDRAGGASPAALGESALTDAELAKSIQDALQRDGRVAAEELDIRCEKGTVHLEGLLPSERDREILHEIVEDTLGFHETVDSTAVDRQPWERPERSGAPAPGKEARAVQMDGEDEEVDVHTSLETGEPMTPPDRLTPEKK